MAHKKFIATILLLLGLLLLGFFFFTNIQIEDEQTSSEISTTTQDGASESSAPEADNIVKVEFGDREDDFGVYIITASGVRTQIAGSDNPDTIEDYFDIVTYHEAYISPNQQHVALQASRFEDSFVAVYDLKTDALHEQWGRYEGWTENNLLKVDACDLSGEECTYLISKSAATPWLFTER